MSDETKHEGSEDPRPHRWSWPLATVVTQGVLGSGIAISCSSGLGWAVAPMAFLVFASSFPVWFLALATAYMGRWRIPVRALVLLVLLFTSMWHIASVLRYRDQGNHLSAYDLWSGWQEPQIRAFMVQSILSVDALLFLLVAGLIFTVVWLCCRRVKAYKSLVATGIILVVATLGSLLANLPITMPGDTFSFFQGRVRPAMAPWARIHNGTMLFTFPSPPAGETMNPADAVAKSLSRTAGGVEWRSPGVPELTELRGRYFGRDILVIILESHRLSDIAPFGKEAFAHQDLCPNIGNFGKNAWWFRNYFQAGHGTIWAIFSTLTGVTPPVHLSNHRGAGAQTGNRLTAQGLLPEFASLGYHCDFLVGCEYTFWDLSSMLQHAQASGPWSSEEEDLVRMVPRSPWGVDDDAIYELAQRRIEHSLRTGRRFLQILKTSSNHQPFTFRESPQLGDVPKSHTGGMRYADDRFGRFIRWLETLPEHRRPIMFVTADHGHTEGLLAHPPLHNYSLEALRIPAFLQLPDGRNTGATLDELISHQDLLSLLLLLVDATPKEVPAKFIDHHRTALAFVQASGYGIMTKNHYRPFWASPQDGKVFEIVDYWRTREIHDPNIIHDMEEMHRACWQEHDRLWNINSPKENE